MSHGQMLRALVNERLAAAAEDIFVLFERTIAEYEEELCRCREDNQKKQQLLDQYPWMKLVEENVQIPSSSLKQEITETPRIKEEPEEQSVKHEELPVPVPEFSAVCVKTEESSLLQQRQTEHQEETQGEDISSEPHFPSETEGHTERSSDTANDVHWEPVNCFAVVNAGLFPKYKSAPETTVHIGHMSGADGGAERKKHQCTFCRKTFGTKQNLTTHIRVHTGERPYSCSFCEKTFNQQSHLNKHKRQHTGEKPYSCTVCEKLFTHKSALNVHTRTHTGDKPYICTVCEKTFSQKCSRDLHLRMHSREEPYSCSVCEKTFALKAYLDFHMKSTHGQQLLLHMRQNL